MRGARIAAALAVGATIAAGGYLAHPGPPDAPAECRRDLLPGEWRCTFPTQGQTAVVYVQAWEDGSARAVAIDPDPEGIFAPEQETTR